MATAKPWQVYHRNGTQISGQSVSKADAFASGTPHAASHIWIWRKSAKGIELLFQKCAPKVAYKVGLLDISAAGHVDAGETEIFAALRELKEEIGLTVDRNQLYFAGVEHYIRRDAKVFKDEFRYVYTLEWDDSMRLTYSDGEVEGVEWVAANNAKEIIGRPDFGDRFVQHTEHYFNVVFSGISGQVVTSKSEAA